MTKMTRQTALAIKSEMRAALQLIATKHGVVLDLGNGTYNESRFGVKVGFNADSGFGSSDAPARTTSSAAIPAHICAHWNIDPTKLGPKGEKLVSFHPRRPQYPFVYETVRGTKWKGSVQSMQAMFGKTA